MVPKRIGSTLKWLSKGMKIGQKITMISVHSSGQPSRKMISCATNWKPSGDRLRLSTQRSISPWPPCSANTAENSAEPTKSQHTIAVVFAVRNVDSLTLRRSSGEVLRYQRSEEHTSELQSLAYLVCRLLLEKKKKKKKKK